MCGAAPAVAEALPLVEAGLPVHLEGVLGAVRGRAGAELGEVALTGLLAAHAARRLQLWVRGKERREEEEGIGHLRKDVVKHVTQTLFLNSKDSCDLQGDW